MKKLLILNSNISSKEIIEYAKSQNIYTIVADRKDINEFSAKRYSDEALADHFDCGYFAVPDSDVGDDAGTDKGFEE